MAGEVGKADDLLSFPAFSVANSPYKNISSQNPACPKCKSNKTWRDGLWQPMFGGPVQRWTCCSCGSRFSDPTDLAKSHEALKAERALEESLNVPGVISDSSQICVEETKNLVAEQEKTVVLRENTIEIKGKMIEFAWYMKKEGLRAGTIEPRVKLLTILSKRGAQLYDTESVKDAIAKQKWCEGRKANAVDAYSSFLAMTGGTWNPPKYRSIPKLPFVPKETEIDQLIAAASLKVGTFLQLLKETGARCGEVWQIEWDYFDFETNTVRITPEKNSNPRIFKISQKLIGMLNSLPKDHGKFVFSNPDMPLDHFRDNFCQQRKRIARKVQNPRILKILFKTMRTWKGTMEYHRTRDVLHVMQILGHKNIKNTLIYIQLEEALFKDEIDYVSKVAKTEAEACLLIESGFEFVCDFEDHKIFRKRKS